MSRRLFWANVRFTIRKDTAMKNRRGSAEVSSPDVLGMVQEAIRQTRKGNLTPDHWRAFVEHRNPFENAVDVFMMLRGWERFYLDVFGLTKDFSALVVPPHQVGFDRLIVVVGGMTPNRLFGACRKHFPSSRYADDLDTVKSERTADHDYAVWVRNCREADEGLRDPSVDDLGKQSITSITLEEQLIYKLKFFKETGDHLDVTNWTTCSGSRLPNGVVPAVIWDQPGGEMCVGLCDPDQYWSDDLRTRVVVSA